VSLFPAQGWMAVGRPDMLAAAVSLFALKYAISGNGEKAPSLGKLFILSSTVAAAFFIKQTALLPAVLVSIRLIQLKDLRSLATVAITCTVMISGLVYLLNAFSDGGYVWQHFTHAKELPLDDKLFDVLITGLGQQPSTWIFVFAVISPVVWLGFNRARRNDLGGIARSPEFLVAISFLISFLLAVASSQRVGANVNYFIESTFLAALCFGMVVANAISLGRLRIVTAFSVAMAAAGSFQLVRMIRGEYFRWQAYAYYEAVASKAAEITKPGAKCVSVYPELLVPTGCALNFDDFSEYATGWSPELRNVFESELRSGRIKTVIWMKEDFSARFPNYEEVSIPVARPERYNDVRLYVLRSDIDQSNSN